MAEEWWQITDFAMRLTEMMKESFNDPNASVHYNTVDKWFKALETKRIHYINRAAGEKVYNKEDLLIGLFIAEKRRDNKWKLDAIYEEVAANFQVRPFPNDDESSMGIDEALLEQRLTEKIQKIMAQQLLVQEEKSMQFLEERLQRYLPEPVDKETERLKRIEDNLARMTIEHQLEEKAIKEWEKLPEEERTKKVGFFRRDTDYEKRDKFIRQYKADHLEETLKEEYDIN